MNSSEKYWKDKWEQSQKQLFALEERLVEAYLKMKGGEADEKDRNPSQERKEI